ncbi:hypothetical protein DAVIS_02623 [Mycobacterium marinum]|uniref:Uncharacterized protein n=1 Tax=Mycobacterium marinum TaxID=1781 RepID=A0A3E2MW30_MYCMR|nr:hypothetical protein [Mycobacterium marinum]RFZ41354.1 hypothetical protein DAVIS_02623 [Mycobacterium marinum]
MTIRYGDCVNDWAARCLEFFRALSDREFERAVELLKVLSPGLCDQLLQFSSDLEVIAGVDLLGALPSYLTSPADGEACTDRGPAAGECPAPDFSAALSGASALAAGAGHPNITHTELHCAAFAVRDYGEQCTTEFARKYWGDIADKLNAAAAANK